MKTMLMLPTLALAAVLLAVPAEAMPYWSHHGFGMWKQDADKNGDGKVTKDEFVDAAKRRAERAFARMDANGDGVLDARDHDARFDKMDADHNGAISREEWRAFHEKMHQDHKKQCKGGK